MDIFLMLPGSPLPDWLLFLSPLIALVIIMQCSQWLYHWFQHRRLHHSHAEQDFIQEGNSDMQG